MTYTLTLFTYLNMHILFNQTGSKLASFQDYTGFCLLIILRALLWQLLQASVSYGEHRISGIFHGNSYAII